MTFFANRSSMLDAGISKKLDWRKTQEEQNTVWLVTLWFLEDYVVDDVVWV